MKQALRAAVVGVGYLGNFHAQKYKDLSQNEFSNQLQLVGVCDLNLEQAQKVASNLEVIAWGAPQELLGHIDLVTIASVTTSHFAMAKLFLQNGIHVNVEKPMTVTSLEALELCDLAAQKKLVLCVGHSERFHPAFAKLQSHPVKTQHLDLQRHAPYKSRGADVSVVHDLMIHDIDLVLKLDASPYRITGAQGACVISKSLDWADAQIQFESGMTAHISASRLASSMHRVLKLIAQDEVFELNFQTGDFHHLKSKKSESGFSIESQNTGKADNLREETKAFVNAVLGRAQPVIKSQDGLRALQLVEEIIAKIQGS